MPTQTDEEKAPSPAAEVSERSLCRLNAMFPGYRLLPGKQKCNTGQLTTERSWVYC